MKTLRLTLVALLTAGFLKAQYFQQVYGQPTSNDVLQSGIDYDLGVPVAQKGYVMAGYTNWPNPSTGINAMMVTNTSLAGVPVFNNAYQFIDPVTGALVSAQGRKVIKLPTNQMAVWGDYSDMSTGISNKYFYALVNPGGALVFVTTYVLPYIPMQVEATSITLSSSGTDVYVCGNITSPGGQIHPVALSLVAGSGAINWGHEYIDVQNNAAEWTAKDLIESPYPNPAGTIDIALAGRYVLTAGGNGQGSVFLIDAATGAVSSQIYLYGNAADDAGLNSIDISNNPFGGVGFILSGFAFNSTNLNYDSWALKLSTSINASFFSSMLDYSALNRDDFGYDIIERRNTTGMWEYYLGGYVINGYFGAEDEVVYKLNAAGFPFGGGDEFTYGGPGNERVLQLDQYNFGVPGINIGLSMFNYTLNSFPVVGQTDFYHVKSYFNGVTACNYLINNSNFKPGFLLMDSVKIDTIGSLQQFKLKWNTLQMRFATICRANQIAGGNNMRLANTTTEEDPTLTDGTVFPNPVSQDNAIVNVKFDAPGNGENVQIELWNTLGQLCLKQNEVFGKGESQLQLDLGNGLSKGIYHLVIRRGEEVLDYKISVQ